nr:hypothetical protein [Saprospiraceae bacterium]
MEKKLVKQRYWQYPIQVKCSRRLLFQLGQIFLFVLLATSISAQRNTNTPDPEGFSQDRGQDTTQTTGRLVAEERDSQFVNYFIFDRPYRQFNLLEGDFEESDLHFDPARSGPWEYARTGHLGSPARPMILEVDDQIGFRTGIEDYKLYWKKIQDQRYYKQARAYSDLMFTQGGDQEQSTTRAMFSNSFEDGFNFSLDYHRINHLGAYSRQRNFSTFISASASHHSEDGKWHNFGTFISNAVFAFENGGIASDTLFEDGFFEDDRTLIPVKLDNAESRQQQRAVYFSNYRLIGEARIFGVELPFYLNHYMSFGNRFYRFSDSSPDSEYYGDFFTVSRGFRRFMEVGSAEQRAGIAIGRIFDFETVIRRNYLNVNLLWASHRVRFDPLEFRVRQWFLSADLGISPGEYLFVEGSGKLGLGDDGGDALLDARAILQIGSDLRLFGIGKFVRRSPGLIENRFPGIEGSVYENDLPRFTHSVLGGGVEWDPLKLRATFKQHLIFNLPYFDENGMSNYVGEAVAIPQLLVQFKPDLGAVISHTYFAWQQQSLRELAIPSIYLKQRLAVAASIFDDALDFQIGADGVFFSDYDAKTYFPVLGNFILTDRRIAGTFRADPFVAFKIQSFKVILRFENIGFLFTDRIDYHFDSYPLPDVQGRITIRWELND